jgi:hypothetical protein
LRCEWCEEVLFERCMQETITEEEDRLHRTTCTT